MPKSWACCAMSVKCGNCCTANIALISFTTALTLAGVSFIVFITLDGCQLNGENFMPATRLRRCLTDLGSYGTERIDFIETYYGNTDYLDQVCGHISKDLVYDWQRTENQTDMCPSDRAAYMYPSKCNQTWIGDDCLNNCTFDNYEGFFCKVSTTTTTAATTIIESTTTSKSKSTTKTTILTTTPISSSTTTYTTAPTPKPKTTPITMVTTNSTPASSSSTSKESTTTTSKSNTTTKNITTSTTTYLTTRSIPTTTPTTTATTSSTNETFVIIECESPFGEITHPGTSIVSPKYPNPYPNDLFCQVTIKLKERVLIVFQEFDVQSCDDCSCDWLEIHDGETSNSTMIGEKLCRTELPSPVNSTGNSMTLVFYSNHYEPSNSTGFKILANELMLSK